VTAQGSVKQKQQQLTDVGRHSLRAD